MLESLFNKVAGLKENVGGKWLVVNVRWLLAFACHDHDHLIGKLSSKKTTKQK